MLRPELFFRDAQILNRSEKLRVEFALRRAEAALVERAYLLTRDLQRDGKTIEVGGVGYRACQSVGASRNVVAAGRTGNR